MLVNIRLVECFFYYLCSNHTKIQNDMFSIYLLRHAETDYNAHNLIIGGRSNHLMLTEKGKAQAAGAGQFF